MLTGTDLIFSIWKDDSDYKNWDKYIEYLEKEPKFREERKQKLMEIYLFLKKEMGRKYMGTRRSDGHNLVNNWLSSRGSRYSELNWLYESLKYFKSIDCNYDKLLGRLRSKDESNRQGIPFLIAGDSLRKAGFEVVFEPDTHFKKQPDLKIINPTTKEIFYNEISLLGDSDETKKIQDNFHFLFDQFHRQIPILASGGRQFKIASNDDLKKLADQIAQVKEEAMKNKSFIEIHKEQTNGFIEFVVAHPEKEDEVKRWAEKKGMSYLDFRGLPLNLDYTNRLLVKLMKESEQIPLEESGLIYLPLPAMYFFLGRPDPVNLIQKVRTALANLPQIIGVVLYSHIGNEVEPAIFEDETIYIEQKIVHEDIQQDLFYIGNENFKGNLSEDTWKKLRASLANVYQ